MARTITVQFDVEVADDDYDYRVDIEGRIEKMADKILRCKGVTAVSTSGPNGSGYVPPAPVAYTPEEIAQRVCGLIKNMYPQASAFHVSSSDQGMFGYWLYNVSFPDGTVIDSDSGTFEVFADTINVDWLEDLRWGAFGDKGSDGQFDVDVTTGKIIR